MFYIRYFSAEHRRAWVFLTNGCTQCGHALRLSGEPFSGFMGREMITTTFLLGVHEYLQSRKCVLPDWGSPRDINRFFYFVS